MGEEAAVNKSKKVVVEGHYGVPVVRELSDAPVVDYYASEFSALLRDGESGGRFFIARTQEMKPEDAPPFHVHTLDDELWIINDGRFRFWIGGDSLAEATVHDVGPGATVYGPRGVAHTFQVLGETGDVTTVWSPGQSESYFLNVEKTDEREDFDHLDRLRAVGVEVLDRAPVNGE